MNIKEIEERKDQAAKEIEAILVNLMGKIGLENRDLDMSVTCWSYKAGEWRYLARINIEIKI